MCLTFKNNLQSAGNLSVAANDLNYSSHLINSFPS